jgi:hypothetical protein
MGVHTMEQVAQLIFGLVSVSQLRPRTASQAASRGVTRKHVDMCGTPWVLDSVSSTNCVMDLTCKVPLNKRRLMGVDNGLGVMLLQVRKLGETKQLEALESNSTQIPLELMKRGRMKESLFGVAASVAVYGLGQFTLCNK